MSCLLWNNLNLKINENIQKEDGRRYIPKYVKLTKFAKLGKLMKLVKLSNPHSK